jgi:hypothetical protein
MSGAPTSSWRTVPGATTTAAKTTGSLGAGPVAQLGEPRELLLELGLEGRVVDVLGEEPLELGDLEVELLTPRREAARGRLRTVRTELPRFELARQQQLDALDLDPVRAAADRRAGRARSKETTARSWSVSSSVEREQELVSTLGVGARCRCRPADRSRRGPPVHARRRRRGSARGGPRTGDHDQAGEDRDHTRPRHDPTHQRRGARSLPAGQAPARCGEQASEPPERRVEGAVGAVERAGLGHVWWLLADGQASPGVVTEHLGDVRDGDTGARQGRGEVVRHRLDDVDPLTRHGVGEGETAGVEGGAVEPDRGGERRPGAVDAVTDDGVPDGGQVDPDLVGAAGLEPAGEQGDGRSPASPVASVR